MGPYLHHKMQPSEIEVSPKKNQSPPAKNLQKCITQDSFLYKKKKYLLAI